MMTVSPCKHPPSFSQAGITDRDMKKMWGEDFNKLAIEIIQTFPLGSDFPTIHSSRLRERISYYTRLFAAVANQWDHGRELNESELVQTHLRGLGAITKSRDTILKQLKQQVILGIDMAVAFPSHYSTVWKKAIGSSAQAPFGHLQAIVEQLDTDTPLNPASQRLFYKQIALFRRRASGTRFYTLADVYYKWAGHSPEKTARATENFYLRIVYLPDHDEHEATYPERMVEEHKGARCVREETPCEQSFHTFLINETIEEYQKMCGIFLPPFFRQSLAEQMNCEAFRLEVAYYTGFPHLVIDQRSICQPEALPYLDGISAINQLSNHCSWDRRWDEQIFTWWLHRSSREIEMAEFNWDETVDITPIIEAISLLEGTVLPPKEFKRYAFEVLVALAPHHLSKLAEQLTIFCRDIDWSHHLFTFESTMPILLQRHFVWANPERGDAICKALKALGVKDTSSHFIMALISPLTPKDADEVTDEIGKLGRKRILVSEILTILIRYRNHRQYARVFQKYFSDQSPDEIFAFYCNSYEATDAKSLSSKQQCIIEETERLESELGLSRSELFQLSCRISEYHYTGGHRLNTPLLQAITEFVGAPLPRGVAACLMRKGVDIRFLQPIVDDYLKLRNDLASKFNTIGPV